MHLIIVLAVIVAVGRWLTARDRKPQPEVTVNHPRAEPWISQQQEQDIIKWIRSGGLRDRA